MGSTTLERASTPDSISMDALLPGRARPVQWKRLWQQLQILQRTDPETTLDAAFSVGDALGGWSEERQVRRFLATSEGRELISGGASLTNALADLDALRALPEGSLGREFLAFSERHGIDPRKLIESQHEMSRDYARLDPVRQYLNDRFTVMHDLWHVLAGYDATTAGESALMCFSLPQRVNDRALPIFIAMSVLTGKIHPRNAYEGFRRGQRARFLSAQPFEELLPMPLEAVREKLGVSPPRVGHPAATTQGMLIPVPQS
jgi:ubiquinone biosynthesis protein COQ4